MKRIVLGVGMFFILCLVSCKPQYVVDLKIRNNTAEAIRVEYTSKSSNKKESKMLNSGEEFSISKYDCDGIDFDWNHVWKYQITSVSTLSNVKSWKDYNVRGAWNIEDSRHKSHGVLVLESTDFLADIK